MYVEALPGLSVLPTAAALLDPAALPWKLLRESAFATAAVVTICYALRRR
jgi:hypothetical protein